MKTKSGVIIIMLLTGLIFGAVQPAVLYAGAEGGVPSDLWAPFVNTNPFKGGTAIHGTLTIIYNQSYLYNYLTTLCSNGQPQTPMLYSVRFIYNGNIYTYVGSTGVCYGDIGTPGSNGQGDVIMAFLKYALVDIFQNPNIQLNLTKVNDPGISPDGFTFVADIVVKVK